MSITTKLIFHVACASIIINIYLKIISIKTKQFLKFYYLLRDSAKKDIFLSYSKFIFKLNISRHQTCWYSQFGNVYM